MTEENAMQIEIYKLSAVSVLMWSLHDSRNDVVGIREPKCFIESIQKNPFNTRLSLRYPKGKVRITVGSRHHHVRPP